MNELLLTVVSALVGALAGLAAAFLRGRSDIDASLRARREAEYDGLLALMAAIPAWPPHEGLTYRRLAALERELRAWYFGGGGLIMSRETRDAFNALQRGIEARRIAAGERLLDARLADHRLTGSALTPLDPARMPHVRGDPARAADDYDDVQQLCSAVRTRMTEDLLSRTRPLALRGRR